MHDLIGVTRHGAVTLLRPDGPITEETAQPLRDAFQSTGAKALGRVVLDCAGVPHLDSEGLETLADLADAMSRSGQALKLVGCNETLRETFELTETASMFEYYADANAAVRSFL